MKSVYFVRHGQTVWNVENKICGATDIELTALGHEQAIETGKKILEEHPGTTGSLGCAISEAVETATTTEGYRYVLGSVLNQVLLHQSVIGLESKIAMDKYGIKPDMIIGCAGGGSNLGGLIAPFMGEKLRGEADYEFIAVEPASCPSLTRGRYV